MLIIKQLYYYKICQYPRVYMSNKYFSLKRYPNDAIMLIFLVLSYFFWQNTRICNTFRASEIFWYASSHHFVFRTFKYCRHQNIANVWAIDYVLNKKKRIQCKGPHTRHRFPTPTPICNSNRDQIGPCMGSTNPDPTTICRSWLEVELIRIFWYFVGGA